MNGVEYDSIAAAADAFKVSYQLVHMRLKRGWSLEQALELQDRYKKTRGEPIVAFGKSYSSIRACALAHDVKPHSLRRILIENRMGVEDAIVYLQSLSKQKAPE